MNSVFEPLVGARVLVIGQYVPGPYCAQLLQQLGATVAKIEPPRGDALKDSQAGMYRALNRGFDVLRLDLNDAVDLARAQELADQCDVFVESLRPGKLARFNLAADQLLQRNPSLIYCSMSGFGQQGPKRDKVGHDLTYLAWSGVLALPSDEHGTIARPSVPVADGAVAAFAAIAILAAMVERRESRSGRHLDVSFAEASMQFAGLRAGWLASGDSREAQEFPHMVPSNDLYTTADGGTVAISLHEDRFWRNFVESQAPDGPNLSDERFSTLAGRREFASELRPRLKRLFAGRKTSHWRLLSENPELPLELVQDIDMALDSDQSTIRAACQRDGTERFLTFPALVDGKRPGASPNQSREGQHHAGKAD